MTDIVIEDIGAVILAAGQSRRMGQQKLSLPWGKATVLGSIIETLLLCHIQEILVVTGDNQSSLQPILDRYPVKTVFNPQYEQAEMLVSLQTGIQALTSNINACFVVLGDQPTIETSTITAVMDQYRQGGLLIIPSYAMRRGHPWLVDRQLWPSILALSPENTMRDFLNLHQPVIQYVNLATDSILKDLDTPQDYHDLAPKE